MELWRHVGDVWDRVSDWVGENILRHPWSGSFYWIYADSFSDVLGISLGCSFILLEDVAAGVLVDLAIVAHDMCVWGWGVTLAVAELLDEF